MGPINTRENKHDNEINNHEWRWWFPINNLGYFPLRAMLVYLDANDACHGSCLNTVAVDSEG